ncbi:MAG TPA: 3-deoxy-7-phosphoheptulonate synthase [Candidatus Polarisedimenticolia bacterium]|nr:3-deoxy-7-phosphoheptulonate synthase [Candidatus Polarisedimenticolia bacterium]
MLIVMDKGVTQAELNAVIDKIERMGYKANPIPGAERVAIGITGNQAPLEAEEFEAMPGVKEAIRVTKPYKLVSREMKGEDTVVSIRGREVGGRQLAIIAGPCAVETEEQALGIGELVAKAGANFFRGGAFKPRTSPYSFQGLGEPGLKILAKVRETTGLPIVTEAMDAEGVSLVEEYADVIQIGARNMQNFSLLKRVGKSKLPVFLKRGIAATMDELLMSAEYVAAEGNYRIMLCERGVRTFADHARNTLDLSVVPAVKHLSHLPILVDPSHGTGRRDRVPPLARAAVAVGADGIMIEVHDHPDRALSDGAQAMVPEQFAELVKEIRALAPLVSRSL